MDSVPAFLGLDGFIPFPTRYQGLMRPCRYSTLVLTVGTIYNYYWLTRYSIHLCVTMEQTYYSHNTMTQNTELAS